MSEKETQLAKTILNILTSQDFFDWYVDGTFASYIQGEFEEGHEKHISEEKMLEIIAKKFKLSSHL